MLTKKQSTVLRCGIPTSDGGSAHDGEGKTVQSRPVAFAGMGQEIPSPGPVTNPGYGNRDRPSLRVKWST